MHWQTALITRVCDKELQDLWSVLAESSLEELRLGYLRLSSTSRLWSMADLTSIKLVSYDIEGRHDGWSKLFNNSPHLQNFGLTSMDFNENLGPILYEGLKNNKQLRSLELINVGFKNVGSNQKRLLDVIGLLPHLERLRVLESRIVDAEYSRMASTTLEAREAFKNNKIITLPALKEVEIFDRHVLVDVLRVSAPTIVRNVVYPPSLPRCLYASIMSGTLKAGDSIKELSLLFYDFTSREQIMEVFRSIPSGVERLAILTPPVDFQAMGYFYAKIKDYGTALDHLSDLKRLVLPWHIVLVLNRSIYSNEDKFAKEARRRAIDVACSFDNPKLEYVFYQGSNDDASSPINHYKQRWEAKFGEDDDLGKRFTVKVTREVNSGKNQTPLSGRVNQGVYIRGEIISESCMCQLCRMKENLDVKKRLCVLKS